MGWKEQGILEHLFIKEDQTGVVLVVKDIDETHLSIHFWRSNFKSS